MYLSERESFESDGKIQHSLTEGLWSFPHVQKYKFIEYIKTITEVLHDLDLNPDQNSVECLHPPNTFLIQEGVGVIVNVNRCQEMNTK